MYQSGQGSLCWVVTITQGYFLFICVHCVLSWGPFIIVAQGLGLMGQPHHVVMTEKQHRKVSYSSLLLENSYQNQSHGCAKSQGTRRAVLPYAGLAELELLGNRTYDSTVYTTARKINSTHTKESLLPISVKSDN